MQFIMNKWATIYLSEYLSKNETIEFDYIVL